MTQQQEQSSPPQQQTRPLYVLQDIIRWESMKIRVHDQNIVLNGDEMNSVGFMPVYDSLRELHFHHGDDALYIEIEGVLVEEGQEIEDDTSDSA